MTRREGAGQQDGLFKLSVVRVPIFDVGRSVRGKGVQSEY